MLRTERQLVGSPEHDLVQRLRAGDETAFTTLVDSHHRAMVRVARQYVASDDLAEEVVQETWLAVMSGIDGFERRSSLRTWMYRILINRAKTRGVREHRSLPFSALEREDDDREPSVPPQRFQGEGHPLPGHWAAPPRPWGKPEERLLSLEVRERLKRGIASLSTSQQLVVTLHDVEGLSTTEICGLLGLAAGNVRVLLHRGRSRLRADLEDYLEPAA